MNKSVHSNEQCVRTFVHLCLLVVGGWTLALRDYYNLKPASHRSGGALRDYYFSIPETTPPRPPIAVWRATLPTLGQQDNRERGKKEKGKRK